MTDESTCPNDNGIIRSKLTASQRKAVSHTCGPLLVVAGPGSGKTTVITHRIAALINSGVPPRNICAITFTNKAAEQMRQRAAALGAPAGAQISTFHSLCVRVLRRYAGDAGIRPNFSIYDASDQARCIRQAVKDCELDTTNFPPARMLDAISTLKNKLIDARTFESESSDYFSRTLGRIYARYQQILDEHNALDFDDLLLRTALLLDGCPDIRARLSNHFRFVLIDEYQDTNHAQYRIAKALVAEHGNICATGDPDQSIYRWRGADIHNILAFEQDWPDAAVVKLEENFRSTPNILSVADNLIAHNLKRKTKKLIPTRPAGGNVVVMDFEDEADEAHSVVRRIEELVRSGASLNDIAVFYRVNSMSRVLEEAFIRSKIAYQVVRGIEFYNRKEIRDILAYLKVLVNPDDEISLLRIINTPARGIGKVTIDRLGSYAATHGIGLFEAVRRAGLIDSLSANVKARLASFVNMLEPFRAKTDGPVAPLAEELFTSCGLEESLRAAGADGKDALENVGELISAAADYDRRTEQPSLVDFLQQISLFSDTDTYDPGAGRVALMTLHAAKGLEFENVFIVGVEEGLLPHERSNCSEDSDELEEERRLLFVGITRAKTNLQISYARYRTSRGQELRTIPSRFLSELGCEFGGDDDDDFSVWDEDEDRDEQSSDRRHPGPSFEPGQLVRHRTFGLGRVKQFIDIGDQSIVVVRFNSGQTKSLMLKYADLVKL